MSHLSDEVLQQLADDQLQGEPRSQAEAHLAACATCQAALAEYRALFAGLESLPVPAPPPRFTAQVMARVDANAHALAQQRRQAAALLGGSVLVACTFFLLAGNGAWARQLTALTGTALHLGQLGHVLGDALMPVILAWRLPLLLLATATCLPTLMALYRSLTPRPRAA